MAQVPLTLATLCDVAGGAVGLMVDHDLSVAAADLDDRGDDGKPRKVVIEVIFTKRADGQVEVDVESSVKAPKRRTPSTITRLAAKPGGELGLLFQQLNPDSPDQGTFPHLDKDEQE